MAQIEPRASKILTTESASEFLEGVVEITLLATVLGGDNLASLENIGTGCILV